MLPFFSFQKPFWSGTEMAKGTELSNPYAYLTYEVLLPCSIGLENQKHQHLQQIYIFSLHSERKRKGKCRADIVQDSSVQRHITHCYQKMQCLLLTSAC